MEYTQLSLFIYLHFLTLIYLMTDLLLRNCTIIIENHNKFVHILLNVIIPITIVGKYAFIEASDNFGARRLRGDKARLMSPLLLLPRACITLDYHMYGRDMGTLNIKIKWNKKEKVLWQKSGNQGNKWMKLQTSIESIKEYSVSLLNAFRHSNMPYSQRKLSAPSDWLTVHTILNVLIHRSYCFSSCFQLAVKQLV